ncbi:ribosomal-protein-serine acetyltransferase [Ligilactobacillus salitolerans]|uniref:Ribosomal-protein-serine acetyltransferase n=1 Tax=Ligilactobacillus salitolerans TaxID=1808352 RepID=A0A401IT22_9LACO|nr:GNAT family protein [Ligilactobacillus salitolerans]GBG94682.1 ribosomal-protein-serine acetyltransferase [Ligilactobacillus salitolerans]
MFTYQIDDEVSLAIPRPTQDSEILFNLIDKDRTELSTWLPWVKFVKSSEDEEGSLKEALQNYANGKALDTIIFYQNKIAGMISFNSFDESNKKAEIGYWLSPDFVGKGIMHRAVTGMCDLGFKEYNLHKIELLTAKDNDRSNHVAKKAGFHLDGEVRSVELLADGFHDGYLWTLLEDEWIIKKADI